MASAFAAVCLAMPTAASAVSYLGNQAAVADSLYSVTPTAGQKYSLRFTAEKDMAVASVWLDTTVINSGLMLGISLQKDNGGLPSGTPLGLTVATSSASAWTNQSLAASLTAGQVYHIVIEATSMGVASAVPSLVLGAKPRDSLRPFDQTEDANADVLAYDGTSWTVVGAKPIFVLMDSSAIQLQGNSYDAIPSACVADIGGATRVAEYFSPAANMWIDSVGAYLKASASTPIASDGIYYQLYDVAADNIFCSGLLASGANVGTGAAWAEATMAAPMFLEKGKQYALILESGAALNYTHYQVPYSATTQGAAAFVGLTYDGLNARLATSLDGSTYTPLVGADMAFRLRVAAVTATPTITPTASDTPGSGVSDTPTSSATATPSRTPSRSATTTITQTPSSSPTATYSPSPLYGGTPMNWTATSTPSATATGTVTPTPSATEAVATHSSTPTSGPTAVPTPVPSPPQTVYPVAGGATVIIGWGVPDHAVTVCVNGSSVGGGTAGVDGSFVVTVPSGVTPGDQVRVHTGDGSGPYVDVTAGPTPAVTPVASQVQAGGLAIGSSCVVVKAQSSSQVVVASGGALLGVAVAGSDGYAVVNLSRPLAGSDFGSLIVAQDGVAVAGLPSAGHAAGSAPTVDQVVLNEGISHLTGHGTSGGVVYALDGQGRVLGSATVGADGLWTMDIMAGGGTQVTIMENGLRTATRLAVARAGSDGKAFLGGNIFRPGREADLPIQFKPTQDGRVTVRVFSLSGELVRPVAELDVKQGVWMLAAWNGRNSQGGTVASGIYFVSVQGAGINSVRKVAVLR